MRERGDFRCLAHQLHGIRGDFHRRHRLGRAFPAQLQQPDIAAPGEYISHRINAALLRKMLQQEGISAKEMGIINGDLYCFR